MITVYDELIAGKTKVSLVGLGYVGMPLAIAFAKKVGVIGFDTNETKIQMYKNGEDPTNEVGGDVVKASKVEFTSDPSKLKEARFHIVAVPTPVNPDHTPDLSPVQGASKLLGQNLEAGSVVVFESDLSGYNDMDIFKGWQAGVNCYLIKPFTNIEAQQKLVLMRCVED